MFNSNTQDFHITDLNLGKGSSAVVKLAMHLPSSSEVAAKVFSLSKHSKRQQYEIEARVLASVDHPNIVKFRGKGVTAMPMGEGVLLRQGVVYMDFLDTETHPTLYSYIFTLRYRLSKREAMRITLKVADALSHLHDNGFAHRDIKPENLCIRLCDKEPILFDFGYAYDVNGRNDDNFTVGSPLYMSPEVLLEKPERQNPFPTDVWGLGLLLYIMVHRKRVNENITELDRLKKTVSEMDAVPVSCRSHRIKVLLAGMLAMDPNERWELPRIQEYIRAYLG